MSHQVRLSCQVYPARHNACRMVQVLTPGKPSGASRSARCSVLSDQVAVLSASRSGGRRDAVRALAANPLVMRLDLAERLYDELLAAHRDLLPDRLAA